MTDRADPATPRRRLLDWFERSRRDLPWRRDADPYRVWVSEVMLQQTRVETVIPYFRRFLDRFPRLEALAAAEEEEVLGLWSGLGYYRRARQLHRAARQVAAAGGELPRSAAELELLPGIGPYTAAAIASIAFGEAIPVVDGNVERVICRWLAFDVDPRRAAGRRRVVEAAGRLVDPRRPGDSNQALMELGATVCTPAGPRCPRCPLAAGCRAAAAGEAEAYPRPRRRRAVERLRRLAVVVERRGRLLLFRRPESRRLMPGLWETPWVGTDAPPGRELARRYGGEWTLGPSLGTVRHAITHRLFEVEVRAGRLLEAESVAEGAEAGWFSRREIAHLPHSSLLDKVLARLVPRSP